MTAAGQGGLFHRAQQTQGGCLADRSQQRRPETTHISGLYNRSSQSYGTFVILLLLVNLDRAIRHEPFRMLPFITSCTTAGRQSIPPLNVYSRGAAGCCGNS